jgi:ABC-type microcin C transport system duplicated ATPase subunit YejF
LLAVGVRPHPQGIDVTRPQLDRLGAVGYGLGVFLPVHLRVAAQICDYVAVMSKGHVVEYGSAEQVFGSPQAEYTKALFAAAPGRHWEFGKFAA